MQGDHVEVADGDRHVQDILPIDIVWVYPQQLQRDTEDTSQNQYSNVEAYSRFFVDIVRRIFGSIPTIESKLRREKRTR